MAIARGLVEELLVDQRQQRSTLVRLDQDGDERLALRRRAPGPGEDELFVAHHLAVDAADVMLLAVLCVENGDRWGRVEADGVSRNRTIAVSAARATAS